MTSEFYIQVAPYERVLAIINHTETGNFVNTRVKRNEGDQKVL